MQALPPAEQVLEMALILLEKESSYKYISAYIQLRHSCGTSGTRVELRGCSLQLAGKLP